MIISVFMWKLTPVTVVNMLLHLYETGASSDGTKDYESIALPNGHSQPIAHQRARDAEEFELEGLVTDDEDERRDATKPEGNYSPNS